MTQMLHCGECGREREVADIPGFEVVEIVCKPCYWHLYGAPVNGFVGFTEDGWLLTLQSVAHARVE